MADSSTTITYYDVLAPHYDITTANGAWTPNIELRAELRLIIPRPATGLDIGCGTGQSVSEILAVHPRCQVLATDGSEEMLVRARAKFPDVECRAGVFPEMLTPALGTFDLVTAIGILEFVPDLPSVLPDLIKHLHIDGTLLFTYEPLIAGYPGQSDRHSTTKGNLAGNKVEFSTFRWNMHDIEKALLAEPAITIQTSRLFVSYTKPANPVIYHLIRAVLQ